MGLTYAYLELSNARKIILEPVNVKSLIDGGSLMLCKPEHLPVQIELDEFKKREVFTSDAKSHLVSYVVPVRCSLKKRYC
jgi:hypothetical protein